MSDDVAAQNFMMNTLRGMGGGGGNSEAGGTPLAAKVTEGFGADKPLFGFSGMDKVEKRIQPPAFVTVAKFFEGIQGQAQTVSLQSVSLFQTIQPPKPTPNMPEIRKGLFSAKGGGK
jgi:hypothetical protein